MKVGYLTVGVVVGAVFMLLAFLAVRDGHTAYASPGAAQEADAGKVVLAPGGTQTNINDMVWMAYRRPMDPRTRAQLGQLAPEETERLTLAVYRIDTSYNMELVGVRDVTFDHMMIQYPTDEGGSLGRRRGQNPTVRSILEEMRNENERRDR